MAKKKNSADRAPDVTSSAPPPSSTAVEVAYASGNYAAVQHLAKQDRSETAQRLASRVRVDMTQLAVGVGALLVVTIVALLVLR